MASDRARITSYPPFDATTRADHAGRTVAIRAGRLEAVGDGVPTKAATYTPCRG
ncbi:MAG TPA: hypothetical protein VI814_10890 [Candidatus Limnocylindria bacterium]